MERRVVITGMGAITPIGIGKETFWQGLLSGVSGVRDLVFPDLDMGRFETRIAAQVQGFDPLDHLPQDRKLKYCGRASLFALAATRMALEDAGFALEKEGDRFRIPDVDPGRVGVILGAAAGNVEIMAENQKRFQKEANPRRISPHALPYYLISAIPALVSARFTCQGMSYVISTACASSAQAIGNSYHRLRQGQEDILITGGADCGLNPLVFGGFIVLRAMSSRNEAPEKASRPFDTMRDGFVMGEGAGILVMEGLDHALKRGAPIYAEVKGFGATSDAFHLTAPEPTAGPFVKAMAMALEDAGMQPGDIHYINAHGTSTRLNDVVETLGFKKVFGKGAYEVPISSTKSMIGHLLGAAGGVELIATVMTLRDGVIHPTVNLDHPDPECDLDYVPHVPRRAPVRNAMSTCLGFGGYNGVLIVSAYEG